MFRLENEDNGDILSKMITKKSRVAIGSEIAASLEKTSRYQELGEHNNMK